MARNSSIAYASAPGRPRRIRASNTGLRGGRILIAGRRSKQDRSSMSGVETAAKCPVQTGVPNRRSGVAAVRLWHSGVSNAHGKTLQWKTENVIQTVERGGQRYSHNAAMLQK